MRGWIIVLLTVSGIMLLAGNAQAQLTMEEKEHVQSIVWGLEIVVFVTVMAIAWFVWRISKRAKESKKSKLGNS